MRPTIFIVCLVLFVPLSAAALPDLPTSTPLRVIFVTSTTTNGNTGGLAGADSHVQAAASLSQFLTWATRPRPRYHFGSV